MIKKWFAIINNHSVSLRDRMFRLVSGVCMVALLFILPMGGSFWNFLALVVCLFAVSRIVKLSLQKRAISAGATAVSVLLLLVFPFCYFTAGGYFSGVPEWFILCFIYICITLRGARRAVFFVLCVAETLFCYAADYSYPLLAAQNTRESSFFDSAFSVVMVGLLTSVLLMFLSKMYEEENELTQQQKKEIEELNRAENHFFSSMSHEIRTPINTIIGLNEMILRSDVPEDVAENARNIQGASKMLLSLINDTLDLSKIKSGKMEILPVPFESGALLSEVVSMVLVKAREKGLKFKLHIDPALPSVLMGDEVRVKQILINLLNNAVKYTLLGSVTLTVRCDHLSNDRVRVWYSVEDTGQGMKKENIPYIFNAFRRVDEEKNRFIEGTGLGLSIVQQLVEMMGGEISVNSVYTKGSKFLVRLDHEVVDQRPLGEFNLDSRPRTREGAQYIQSFEAPDAHILVVDDNDMNLMVVKKLLSATRVQIDAASSGPECLRLTQNHHYDCILMDHMMPEMDGIECLHALRAQPVGLCRDVPVVALTANAGTENQLLYRREGFSGYLAKPVSGALLEAAVLSVLPKDLVRLSPGAEGREPDNGVLIFEPSDRRPILVTTDSVCDLPEALLRKLGVQVCPYYISTENGRFLDGDELMTGELLGHMSEGRLGRSQAPDPEDYERFFADMLTKAQNVVHITLAKHVSLGYQNACEAAKSFENVTVVDSRHLSSAMGLVVLCAAYMADHHASKEDIIDTVRRMARFISSDFVINNTQMLHHAGRVSRQVQILCDSLLLHPVFRLKKSRMVIRGVKMGSFERVARSYVKRALMDARNIDRRILFITYSGMDEDKLKYIRELVDQHCPFQRVYLQEASPAIASNCGPGAFGLMFMKRSDGAASFFQAPGLDEIN